MRENRYIQVGTERCYWGLAGGGGICLVKVAVAQKEGLR